VSDREDYFGPDGRPQVLAGQCSTCIGRPGNLMRLNPGRVKGMVQSALNAGGGIICHQTLSYGDHPEQGGAVCRWFYDHYGRQSNGVRVQSRVGGGFREIELPCCEDDEDNEDGMPALG
jgi:hypothetical protein